MKQYFIDHISKIQPLSQFAIDFIKERLVVLEAPKNTFLVNYDEVNNKIYFMFKGLARSISRYDEKEQTSWLVKENDFVNIVNSFLNQTPSKEAIQVLEDSVLIYLSYQHLQEIYDTIPETNKIGRLVSEEYLKLYDNRINDLKHPVVGDRLRIFIEKYQEFFERVPNKYLASYLNTTPETISRILSGKNIS